jgi:SAM-dependent methyltransferase
MATVEEHYDRLLSDVYSWMYGGWDAALARYTEFFAVRGIAPRKSRRVVDLGAGCGFQAIPLARLEFQVTAIDLDRKPLELAVCMVDTLLHLPSEEVVEQLFLDVFAALEPDGTFIATFRDFSVAAEDLDRFISVRNDERMIFTCFLEFEPGTVKVHDLVYRRVDGRWEFAKSFYRKLRLSTAWAVSTLRAVGFKKVETALDRGLVVVTATK